MVKAVRNPCNSKEIIIQNHERIPEEMLLEQLLKEIRSLPEAVIGKRQMGPSEDFYRCSVSDISFYVWYDIDYGVSLTAENEDDAVKLLDLFDAGK